LYDARNMDCFMLNASQCRAARALIEWSWERLAELSHVGLRTIVDFERGARDPGDVTIAALRRTLEAAGVEFIPENGGGAGVRMRKSALHGQAV
jgi:transcriptional regulator with XRE-family HTH domain